jgi:hypothetical protein
MLARAQCASIRRYACHLACLPVFVLSAEREDLRGQHRLLTLGRVWCYGCEEGLTWVGVGWWAGCMARVAGFVGRKRELAFLRAALGGDTRMVLMVGDAGVGKTWFAEEGMRRAAAGGMVPVWGRCLPLAEKLPLLPVAGALGVGFPS